MHGVDPEMGISALRLWVAASAAALLVTLCASAFALSQTGILARAKANAAVRAGFAVFGAILGAAIAWSFAGVSDQAGPRRALEMRAAELSARSQAPGSPLACLDGLIGEALETACEKVLFASPANAAAATSYVAAQLALLADGVAYANRGGDDIEDVLMPLRRSLEADRFGFVSHVLVVRDGCTSANCAALALFRDPREVRAKMDGGTLDRYVEHYALLWAKSPDNPTADASQAQRSVVAAQPSPPVPHRVNIDFPTAASIPPISIMNPEPKGPVLPGVAAAAAANPNPPATTPSASRHPRKQAASAPAPVPAPSSPAGSPGAGEPIWPEPVPPPPATSGAAATNPGATAPEANAGTGVRAQ